MLPRRSHHQPSLINPKDFYFHIFHGKVDKIMFTLSIQLNIAHSSINYGPFSCRYSRDKLGRFGNLGLLFNPTLHGLKNVACDMNGHPQGNDPLLWSDWIVTQKVCKNRLRIGQKNQNVKGSTKKRKNKKKSEIFLST